MQENIELLTIPARHCRNCRSFIRVRDNPKTEKDTFFSKVVHREGFCLLGQREGYCGGGDFSLYHDSPNPHCNSFVYDDYNNKTTEIEQKFKDWHHKLIRNSYDRRTKEFKLLDQYRKYLDRPELFAQRPEYIFGIPIQDSSFKDALYRLGDDRLIEITAELYITSVARTQLHELNCRKAMPFKEYDRMLGYIRFQLADCYDRSICNNEADSD